MFHTNSKLDLVNGLLQCHTILHIDITKTIPEKVNGDFLNLFNLFLSTKLNLTYGAYNPKQS